MTKNQIFLQESQIESAILDTTRTYLSYTLLKSRFDENKLLKSELNKSKINHNNTLQQLQDEITILIEKKVFLLYLMGIEETTSFDFKIVASLYTKYDSIHPQNAFTLNEHPDLKILTAQNKLSTLQANTELAKHIPIISLNGYLGASQFTNAFNPVATNSWFGVSYVGLNVKLPILLAENTKNKIQQLKLQEQQYLFQHEDKSNQLKKDAFTAIVEMDNLNNKLNIQEENIALSLESIEIFQFRFKEGQESALNLNVEEADLQILQAQYDANKNELWVYWLNYLKATGQLYLLWN